MNNEIKEILDRLEKILTTYYKMEVMIMNKEYPIEEELEEAYKTINKLTNQLKEFKEEHKIMKQILIENGLWERLLNDDRFLKYLRDDEE